MIKFATKYRKTTIFLLIIFVLIAIPWVTQKLINVNSNQMGSDDGWLGFWGGYLGAIIGVVGAYLILQMQVQKETEAREREKVEADKVRHDEKVDNTFFNLLALHNEQQNNLNGDLMKQFDSFKKGTPFPDDEN